MNKLLLLLQTYNLTNSLLKILKTNDNKLKHSETLTLNLINYHQSIMITMNNFRQTTVEKM